MSAEVVVEPGQVGSNSRLNSEASKLMWYFAGMVKEMCIEPKAKDG